MILKLRVKIVDMTLQNQQQYISVKLIDIADIKMLLGTFNNEFVGSYSLLAK